jgi:hypothetical protein
LTYSKREFAIQPPEARRPTSPLRLRRGKWKPSEQLLYSVTCGKCQDTPSFVSSPKASERDQARRRAWTRQKNCCAGLMCS